MSEALFNRIRKVARHRRKWARRAGHTAYRIYDRDIPEHRYTVDWYDGHALVTAYPGNAGSLPDEVLQDGVAGALEIPPEAVVVRSRRPEARGRQQYEKQDETGETFVVEEAGLKFQVNIHDYIDTGLFMDHRNTRIRVGAEAAGKRVLNLFCYTGAFTVHAAAGGASETLSVDLSNGWLAIVEQNLALNGLKSGKHRTLRADVLAFLARPSKAPWDIVILDPPSYSASKGMQGSFDVQRDHPTLLAQALGHVKPGGVLYFSTNRRDFELESAAVAGTTCEELTPASIPEDFRDRTVHRCWRIVRPVS